MCCAVPGFISHKKGQIQRGVQCLEMVRILVLQHIRNILRDLIHARGKQEDYFLLMFLSSVM